MSNSMTAGVHQGTTWSILLSVLMIVAGVLAIGVPMAAGVTVTALVGGATVLRGPMGFGRHSRVHTAKLLELSTDLPVVIEIVDAEAKVDAFLPRSTSSSPKAS